MTTDRQKSFLATIGTKSSLLHFLDEMHGERAISTITFASGGIFSGRPQTRDDSHLLGLRTEVQKDSKSRLALYFRHTNYGYRLYIRTPGSYYGMCLSTNKNGFIGAFPSAESDTFFLTRENGMPINLGNLKETTPSIYLQVRNSGFLHAYKFRGSPYIYVAAKDGAPLAFNLSIMERNAPYIGHPDEI